MSGQIPREFIDDLISRVDIVELIDARVSLKKTGTNYSACCPFHQEKTPSFTVSPQKQFYYCFGCGAHGNAIGFLINYENLGFPQAVEQLAHELGVPIPKDLSTAPQVSQEQQLLLKIMAVAAQYFAQNLRDHPERDVVIEYLKGRGLTGKVAKQFLLGYAPTGWDGLLKHLKDQGFSEEDCLKAGVLSANDQGRRYDRFRSRLMFPIRNRKGSVIAFGGRVLDDAKPKYLNSPETPVFHKSEILYGVYELTQVTPKPSRIIVVEGYMDVVALEQSGIHGTVATLGTAITNRHCRELFRQANQSIVFCFDGDEAGKKAAWRALEVCLPLMQEGRNVQFLFLPQGEDPDSFVRRYGVDDFHKQLDRALTFTDYFLQYMLDGENVHTIEGRSHLFAKAKPDLVKLPQNMFGHMLINQFAEIMQLEAAEVRTYLQQPIVSVEPKGNYQAASAATSAPPAPPMPGTVAPPARQPHNTYQARPRSPQLRMPPRLSLPQRIISLLLTRPTLWEYIQPQISKLLALTSPETDLLRHLLVTIQNATSTGGVLEAWRDSEHSGELALLATREWELSDEGLQHELTGSIERLLEHEQERKHSELIAKISEHGLASLSDEEKTLLGLAPQQL